MSTLLTTDWLKNNMAYNMIGDASFQKVKYQDYYDASCDYIRSHHFLSLTPSQIEVYIADGSLMYNPDITLRCPIDNADERRRLFLSAQAKQLIFDFTNGRGAMIRGADMRYNACPDFVSRLKMLGLYQRTQTTV